MTRRRKSRPADISSEQTLARAVRFDVALFAGWDVRHGVGGNARSHQG